MLRRKWGVWTERNRKGKSKSQIFLNHRANPVTSTRMHSSKMKLSQERAVIIVTHHLLHSSFMSPRLHKACIPSSSCKLLPPTAEALSCEASKWTLPFLTSKEALELSPAAWEGGRDWTLTWAVDCWPCWPSWRLGKNMDWGDITGKKRETIARSQYRKLIF